ncbi:hypothetical protein ACFCXS_19380 [Streptomyces sp. NPDC056373]|uniref:hypothetical protein n=1 Tax=Streptomyces sp. NPDC056373 TaxID=3345798 RepID=UPI0035D73F61
MTTAQTTLAVALSLVVLPPGPAKIAAVQKSTRSPDEFIISLTPDGAFHQA